MKQIDVLEKLQTNALKDLQSPLEARDKARLTEERLLVAIAENEGKVEDLARKIQDLTQALAERIGEAADVSKIQKALRSARIELSEVQDLVTQLKTVSLPEAKQAVKVAQADLEASTKRAIASIRGEYEAVMSKHIDAFMDCFDSWNSSTGALYKELGLTVVPGSADEVPRVVNDRFRSYALASGMALGTGPPEAREVAQAVEPAPEEEDDGRLPTPEAKPKEEEATLH